MSGVNGKKSDFDVLRGRTPEEIGIVFIETVFGDATLKVYLHQGCYYVFAFKYNEESADMRTEGIAVFTGERSYSYLYRIEPIHLDEGAAADSFIEHYGKGIADIGSGLSEIIYLTDRCTLVSVSSVSGNIMQIEEIDLIEQKSLVLYRNTKK